MQASAQISTAGGRGFGVRSSRRLLFKKGARTVELDFSKRQLRALRSAVARHRRIDAHVSGALLDSGGNVEATTPVVSLRIRR